MHHRVAVIISCVIGAESVLVMAGWIFGIDRITRILPQGINMKFPTALLFFASAVGLYYISREIKDHSELSQVILPGVALFIFLITSVLLAGGLFNTQTGIENLFVKDQSPLYTWRSGWPSLFTMICFILFGLADIISLFPVIKRKKWLKFIGSAIFMIGLISIFGYALNQPFLYYQFTPGTTPIAFNTGLTFVLLGLGLVTVGKTNKNNEA